jgi:hypothetical protein
MMANYDFDYAIGSLRQAVDFAEVEHDFVPLRKWVNEVEQSGHELQAMESRLNLPAGQEVLLSILNLVAAGSVSPEDALQQVRRWLNNGVTQEVETELSHQYQFA